VPDDETQWQNQVPAHVMAALDRVLVDTQDAHPLDLELGWDPRPRWPVLWIRERGETSAEGLGVSPDWEDEEELVLALADWLQEQVFPGTRDDPGRPRPACPGHPHPATTDVVDGEAWWICPGTRRRIARIGDLARIRGERPKVTFPRKGTIIRIAPPGTAGSAVAVHVFVDVRDADGHTARWVGSACLTELPASGEPLPGLQDVCDWTLEEHLLDLWVDLHREYDLDRDVLDDVPVEHVVER
jgi:hypothetical protein